MSCATERVHDMPSEKLVCSICQHEIPAAYLRSHQEQENKAIVAYTIDLIKESHPDWTEKDPTCQKCWDQYRQTYAK
jgi:protein-arginine kinase activator protein McsA